MNLCCRNFRKEKKKKKKSQSSSFASRSLQRGDGGPELSEFFMAPLSQLFWSWWQGVRRIAGWESMRQTWLLQPHNRIRQSPHQNILSQLSCHITLVHGGSITLALPLFSVMSCLQSRETPADKDYKIISDLWPRGVEGLLHIRECLRMSFLLIQSVMMISSNESVSFDFKPRAFVFFFYFCGGGVFSFLKFADYQWVEDVTNIDLIFFNSWPLAQGCVDWIERRSGDLWFNELNSGFGDLFWH